MRRIKRRMRRGATVAYLMLAVLVPIGIVVALAVALSAGAWDLLF